MTTMKKKYILLTLGCMLGIQLFADSNMPGKPTGNEHIFLHHQGNVSLYEASQLEDAVKASTDGDTLFLTNGNYGFVLANDGKEMYYGAKPIRIEKSVCIVGEGENTYIGALSIAPTDTKKECHLYGIKSNLSVPADINKLDIQKCYVQLNTSASITEADIKQSKVVVNFNGWNAQWPSFKLTNCIIMGLTFQIVNTDNLKISLNNCNIYELMGSGDDGDDYINSFKGTITNSIIDHLAAIQGETRYLDGAVTLTNVLIRTTTEDYDPFKLCKQTNSAAIVSTEELINDKGECRWSTDELTQKGYLGTDGTVMGIYGGTTPYTLAQGAIELANPTLNVNTANKKLMFKFDIK